MNHEAWEALRDVAPLVAATRPSVGRTVRVMRGKRYGIVGRVTWHGVDRYANAFRYCDEMQAQIRDIAGRYGFRVRIEADGAEPFFVPADAVMVCVQ